MVYCIIFRIISATIKENRKTPIFRAFSVYLIGATDWDRTKAPGFWGWFFGGFSLISFIVFLLCIIFCIIKTSGELAWILDEVKQTGY